MSDVSTPVRHLWTAIVPTYREAGLNHETKVTIVHRGRREALTEMHRCWKRRQLPGCILFRCLAQRTNLSGT